MFHFYVNENDKNIVSIVQFTLGSFICKFYLNFAIELYKIIEGDIKVSESTMYYKQKYIANRLCNPGMSI